MCFCRRFRGLTWCAFAMVFLLVVPAQAADRALLVGVEKHADTRIPDTPGAAADAQALASVLESEFGFERSGIRTLIDEEATAERIESEYLNWLVAGTRPGDRAFFLFSGHGSRIPDDNGDEQDSLDETLVAYDADAETGDGELRDDLMDALVASLSGRRAVVVFDAASAGKVIEGADEETAGALGTPRFVPGPGETPAAGTGWRVVADESSSESFLDRPGEIGNLSGIVVVSAARPGQMAYSIDADGESRGALSFVFASLYGETLVDGEEGGVGGSTGTSRGLMGKVGKKMAGTMGSAVKKTALNAVPGSGIGQKLGKDVVGTVAGAGVKKAKSKVFDGKSSSGSSRIGSRTEGSSTGSSGGSMADRIRTKRQGSESAEGGTTAEALPREGTTVEAVVIGATPPAAVEESPTTIVSQSSTVIPPQVAPAPAPVATVAPAATTAVPATSKAVTVGALPGALAAGMDHLSSNGLMPDGQDPWFEVLSEQPIEPQPLFGDWQQAASVALQNPLSMADVKVTTTDGRSTFRDGDELEFEISSDRDGYLYLLIFSENDVATCIFPNPGDLDNRVDSGKLVLPGNRSYSFPVQEPFGTDVVLALVSEERVDLCDRMTYTWDQVYAQVDLSGVQESLRARSTRGVGVSPAGAAETGGAADWQTASFVVTTKER